MKKGLGLFTFQSVLTGFHLRILRVIELNKDFWNIYIWKQTCLISMVVFFGHWLYKTRDVISRIFSFEIFFVVNHNIYNKCTTLHLIRELGGARAWRFQACNHVTDFKSAKSGSSRPFSKRGLVLYITRLYTTIYIDLWNDSFIFLVLCHTICSISTPFSTEMHAHPSTHEHTNSQ